MLVYRWEHKERLDKETHNKKYQRDKVIFLLILVGFPLLVILFGG